MKVLVTGATGFVGRHLTASLLAHGHQVTTVARDESKARSMPWFSRVQFLATDLHATLPHAQIEAFSQHDALVHLAWPGLPNYKSLFHIDQNLPADFRFIRTLVEAGLPQVLVTGTCFEYGMQSGCLDEALQTRPGNPYALAKDGLRRHLQALQQVKPFRLQWARLFYMFGKGQNPNSLLAQLDRAIEAGDEEFRMSGGEQLRDFLPVSEVAERLAELVCNTDVEGIFNICSGEPISVRRLVEQHIAERGANIRPILGHYPYPDYEPMAFWGDSHKFMSLRKQ
ncbi:MAG: dependent epimerase/dehydratase family protein [Rhodocyclales bacterium]|nr:dependent epimerase/dehydratase family protein [Rhodocyclales bacterium]